MQQMDAFADILLMLMTQTLMLPLVNVLGSCTTSPLSYMGRTDNKNTKVCLQSPKNRIC